MGDGYEECHVAPTCRAVGESRAGNEEDDPQYLFCHNCNDQCDEEDTCRESNNEVCNERRYGGDNLCSEGTDSNDCDASVAMEYGVTSGSSCPCLSRCKSGQCIVGGECPDNHEDGPASVSCHTCGGSCNGDNLCRHANNGQCEEARHGGANLCVSGSDSADCAIMLSFEYGVSKNSACACHTRCGRTFLWEDYTCKVGATCADIEDPEDPFVICNKCNGECDPANACYSANDQKCDEERFGGSGTCPLGRDTNDCTSAQQFEYGASLKEGCPCLKRCTDDKDGTCPVGKDCASANSDGDAKCHLCVGKGRLAKPKCTKDNWCKHANDLECDEARFVGQGFCESGSDSFDCDSARQGKLGVTLNNNCTCLTECSDQRECVVSPDCPDANQRDDFGRNLARCDRDSVADLSESERHDLSLEQGMEYSFSKDVPIMRKSLQSREGDISASLDVTCKDCGLEIDLSLVIELDISWFVVQHARCILEGVITPKVAIQVKLAGSIGYEKAGPVPLISGLLNVLNRGIAVSMAAVSWAIVPRLGMEYKVTAIAEGSVDFYYGVRAPIDVKIGYEKLRGKGGTTYDVFKPRPLERVGPQLTVDVRAEVRFYLIPIVTLRVFQILDLSLRVEPYVGIGLIGHAEVAPDVSTGRLTFEGHVCFFAFYGMDLSFDIQVNIRVDTFQVFSKTWGIVKRTVIWERCFPDDYTAQCAGPLQPPTTTLPPITPRVGAPCKADSHCESGRCRVHCCLSTAANCAQCDDSGLCERCEVHYKLSQGKCEQVLTVHVRLLDAVLKKTDSCTTDGTLCHLPFYYGDVRASALTVCMLCCSGWLLPTCVSTAS